MDNQINLCQQFQVEMWPNFIVYYSGSSFYLVHLTCAILIWSLNNCFMVEYRPSDFPPSVWSHDSCNSAMIPRVSSTEFYLYGKKDDVVFLPVIINCTFRIDSKALYSHEEQNQGEKMPLLISDLRGSFPCLTPNTIFWLNWHFNHHNIHLFYRYIQII